MSGEAFKFDFGTGGSGDAQSVTMDTDKGSLAAVPASAASAEAGAHLETVRRKRGRPAGDSPATLAEREKIREELTREFATLFAPEYWEGIVRGPADLMLAISKREIWNIPEKELKPLAIGASHTARLFLRADPKWIALFMFSVSLTQVYGTRFALHVAQTRKEAREKKRVEDQGKGAQVTSIGKPV